MERRKSTGLVLAAVLFGAAIVIATAPLRRSRPSGEVYYYDLAAGRMFAAPPNESDTQASDTIVRAFVYACGSCDSQERFVAYLGKWDEATMALIDEAGDDDAAKEELLEQARLVAQPPSGATDVSWVRLYSHEGQQVKLTALKRCADVTPHPCVP